MEALNLSDEPVRAEPVELRLSALLTVCLHRLRTNGDSI